MAEPSPPPWPPPAPPPAPPHRQNRLALVIAAIAAVVVVVLAVSVPVAVGIVRDWTSNGSDGTLDDVRVYGGLRADHTEDDVDYDQTPPVGGPHDPAWLDCGVYDVPVRDENAVHSLEHGTVWITYNDDVSSDDVAVLEGLLPDEGILSPYPEQDAPVVITVWGRQLALESADDPRLELFLEDYGDGHTAPEALASCVGGVGTTESGGVDV
jgi:hypothetical protein